MCFLVVFDLLFEFGVLSWRIQDSASLFILYVHEHDRLCFEMLTVETAAFDCICWFSSSRDRKGQSLISGPMNYGRFAYVESRFAHCPICKLVRLRLKLRTMTIIDSPTWCAMSESIWFVLGAVNSNNNCRSSILMFVGAFFKTRNIHTPFLPVYLCQTHH